MEDMIEIRHHDIFKDSHFEKVRVSMPELKIEARFLREEEIYEEGVLPPMLTIFCSIDTFSKLLNSFSFVDSLSRLIDELRKLKEPGFYNGSHFTPAPSLAVFITLGSGEKLKLYIKEKEGVVCKEALTETVGFLNKFNLNELKAKTSLGLIAMYKTDEKSWQAIGF